MITHSGVEREREFEKDKYNICETKLLFRVLLKCSRSYCLVVFWLLKLRGDVPFNSADKSAGEAAAFGSRAAAICYNVLVINFYILNN